MVAELTILYADELSMELYYTFELESYYWIGDPLRNLIFVSQFFAIIRHCIMVWYTAVVKSILPVNPRKEIKISLWLVRTLASCDVPGRKRQQDSQITI